MIGKGGVEVRRGIENGGSTYGMFHTPGFPRGINLTRINRENTCQFNGSISNHPQLANSDHINDTLGIISKLSLPYEEKFTNEAEMCMYAMKDLNFFNKAGDLILPAIATTIFEAGSKPSELKRASFELATLLIKSYETRYILFMFGLTNVHKYSNYENMMGVIGTALNIGSHFSKDVRMDFEHSIGYCAYTDIERNRLRLCGFMGNDETSLRLANFLESKIDDHDLPWRIDVCLATLESLKSIYIDDLEKRKNIILMISKHLDNNAASEIVKERVNETVVALSLAQENPFRPIFDKVFVEYADYIKQVSFEDMSLIKYKLSECGSSCPTYLGLNSDPVDIHNSYSENKTEYIEAFAKVRVDHLKTISFLKG